MVGEYYSHSQRNHTFFKHYIRESVTFVSQQELKLLQEFNMSPQRKSQGRFFKRIKPQTKQHIDLHFNKKNIKQQQKKEKKINQLNNLKQIQLLEANQIQGEQRVE